MLLALSVISAQAGELGPTAYKVFDDRGGSIGRLESNDWTLPDPEKFVSSRHAAVTCSGGQFFLEDTSTNGTFVNQREQPMPKAPVRLNDGDRIYIGDYEILVQLIDDGGAASGLSPILSEDAVAASVPPESAGVLSVDDIGGDDLGTVDPLALLGTGSRPMPPPPPAPRPVPPPPPRAAEPVNPAATQLRPTAAVVPPAPQPPPPPVDPLAGLGPAPAGNSDRTQFRPDRARPAAPSAFAPEPAPRMPEAPLSPEPPRPQAPAPVAPAFASEPPPAPRAPAPPAFASEPIPAAPRTPAPTFAPPPPPAQPAAASAAPGAPPAGAQDLLTALGLDPSRVDPAIQQQLGMILRVVVQGLIEVLHARAEVKNNFRMPMTSIRPVENNPLKFSMNVDDALHNLFVKRNPGYLPPVEAFQEGLQDIAFHQMAMLAGIRTAYNAMLAKFHPDHLEELYDRKLKRTSLIPVGGRLKFWDMYRSQFEDIESDREAHFQRLFGEEFAKAYHEQMQKLALAARQRQRGS